MKNWWYYHKWYVACGAILLIASICIFGNSFGWFKDTPDIQIAYIGSQPLPEGTVSSIEGTFAAMAKDYNHDGKVVVKVNQFVNGASMGGFDAISQQQACELAFIGDIDSCASYFFLMEDPAKVQRDFQILAMPDGSCPPDYDLSADGKTFPWDSKLYLGRRCFYNEKCTPYSNECSQIWDTLQTQYTHSGGLNENTD